MDQSEIKTESRESVHKKTTANYRFKMKQAWIRTTIGNKLIVLFTFVIAVANVIYVNYARMQWHVMSSQLETMQGSGLQTAELIAQTRRAADAAEQANSLASSSSKDASRAYISIIGTPSGAGWTTDPPRIAVEFFSSGNTPAFKVRRAMKWKLIELPLAKDTYFPEPRYLENPFTFQHPETEGISVEVRLTPKEKEMVEGATRGIAVWGGVEYTTFSRVHHTRFCYVMNPDLKGISNRCGNNSSD